MSDLDLRQLLNRVATGELSADDAMEALKPLSCEELAFANLDLSRESRRGFPEVILGERKSVEQIIEISKRIMAAKQTLLVTRVEPEKAVSVMDALSSEGALYHEQARCIFAEHGPRKDLGRGVIAVVTAGTSDIPVAEEAALIAELSGNTVNRIFDVGVSGIHRLFSHLDELRSAEVVIAVAGMEGALPIVVTGLLSKPVIGVPTSVGYGTGIGGKSALLSMLNSCSAGMTVVNIDNGFGAGYAASLMNRKDA